MLIGFGGYYGAGKDAAADRLVSHHQFTKHFMSDPLAKALYTQNPLIYVPESAPVFYELIKAGVPRYPETPTDIIYASYADVVDAVGYTAAKEIREVRRLLQALGTDVGRKQLDNDLWVKVAKRSIEASLNQLKRVNITGIRFPNELEMINDLGGLSVWVKRPGFEPSGDTAAHESETTLTEEDFDIIIDNDSDLKALHAQADRLVPFLLDGGLTPYQEVAAWSQPDARGRTPFGAIIDFEDDPYKQAANSTQVYPQTSSNWPAHTLDLEI